MASCITSDIKGGYSPQVRLTVTEQSSTATTSTLAWTLEYVTHGYTAKTDGAGRAWSVNIDGVSVSSGSFNINDESSRTISSGTKTVSKYSASRSVAFSLSFGFNITWSGVYAGTKTASGSISIGATASYTITYNANGGSGAPAAQTKYNGVTLTLSSTTPTKTGHTFLSWNTKSDGSGTIYSPGSTISSNSNVTLYAQWKENTFQIVFNANGGSGAPSSQWKYYSSNLVLSSTKPTRTGYTFVCWNTKADGTGTNYNAGATWDANVSVTLYAKWTIVTYTITYKANSGTGAPSSQTKNYDQTITLSNTVPTRSNYNFLGWSKTSSGSVVYTPGDKYSGNADLTLYAIWEAASSNPSITNFTAVRKSLLLDQVNGLKNTFNLSTGTYTVKIYAMDIGATIATANELTKYTASNGLVYWRLIYSKSGAMKNNAKRPADNSSMPNIHIDGFDTITLNDMQKGVSKKAVSMNYTGNLYFTIPEAEALTAQEAVTFFSKYLNAVKILFELNEYITQDDAPLSELLTSGSDEYLTDDNLEGNVILVNFSYAFDQAAGTNYGAEIKYKLSSKTDTVILDPDGYRYNVRQSGDISFVILSVTNTIDSVLYLTVTDTNGLSTQKNVRIYAGRYYIDYYDSDDDEVGVSVGKPASKTGFYVNPNAFFNRHIYMQTEDPSGESDIYFVASGGTYNHKTGIYGGNADSKTGLGIWDSRNTRNVLRYNDVDNLLSLGNNKTDSRVTIEGSMVSFVPAFSETSGGNLIDHMWNVFQKLPADEVCVFKVTYGSRYACIGYRYSSGASGSMLWMQYDGTIHIFRRKSSVNSVKTITFDDDGGWLTQEKVDYRKIGNVVHVNCWQSQSSNITKDSSFLVATLPSGYRPTHNTIHQTGHVSGSGVNGACSVSVGTDGKISIVPYITCNQYDFTFSYLVN